MAVLSATQTPYARGWSPLVVRHPRWAMMNIMDGCRTRTLSGWIHIIGIIAFGFGKSAVFPMPFL